MVLEKRSIPISPSSAGGVKVVHWNAKRLHERRINDLFTRIRNFISGKPGPTEQEQKAALEQNAEHERLLAMMIEVKRRFPRVYTVPYSASDL